ncbi:Uncharacterised protein [Mycobacteroides abscessus subsp. abscessus]|uniref:hypothetical protein n=1 Tax=Mycobacteroides abscessus TaxID=36809 RepID=UPI000926848E|nr:hypothetical protein [Mycobacteroides abscessus]MDM2174946.1 hypothetical protein [Mycobacteroides abscessus]MDM2180422.1 hypothetical protein [Mycobacteroides abscessus]MDM2208055.1 hypothetical protein [Mycobacteroides abscessus]MDM2214664.1 hypothetical protein [Mycobacteroides abscessus]MDM2219658.1 hypothetical protein [Mycobacteroides abscessus]
MLERERREDPRRVYYVRCTSPLWEIIELAAEVIGLRWDDGRVNLGEFDGL